MIPKPPPREGALGFLYLPPYRVQGVSVAGEATCVMVPELDVCFDMGVCPRAALPSKLVAITHGHMDHIGGLAYFCSQRYFQGMGAATLVCDARIAPAVEHMMEGYVDLERQKTPYELISLEPDRETPIKGNIFLRGLPSDHTTPSIGYVVVEKRSKLKEEYAGLPQEKLCDLKARGTPITRTVEIPLITYFGDTLPGPHLLRDDVLASQIVVCECTFTEPDQRDRAKVGGHMHAADIAEWLPLLRCDTLVLTHLSRRTNMSQARARIAELVGPKHVGRVEMLMDIRQNRQRYDRQEAEAQARAATPASPSEP